MKKVFGFILSITFAVFNFFCGGNAENIKPGILAPDFTLQDITGKEFKLSSYREKSPVVIYFYPKASTPGCTKQACGIRDNFSQFADKGIEVFGISVDSKEDIKKFAQEYSLNFTLLSDESKEVSQKYGVLNKLGFSSRITFIVDRTGNIAHILRDVDVSTHADDVFKLALALK
jgi:peroxiredoxin Q/BCP